jgi:hypothetical protein
MNIEGINEKSFGQYSVKSLNKILFTLLFTKREIYIYYQQNIDFPDSPYSFHF